MNIVICEDDKLYLAKIESILARHIADTGSNSHIALSTASAADAVAYIRSNAELTLYFLDIKLNQELTGFDLAAEIRKKDHMSHIVF